MPQPGYNLYLSSIEGLGAQVLMESPWRLKAATLPTLTGKIARQHGEKDDYHEQSTRVYGADPTQIWQQDPINAWKTAVPRTMEPAFPALARVALVCLCGVS
jgi:hypothetical protein